jgi:hypothetical protein
MREIVIMVFDSCPDCAAGDIVPDEEGNCTNSGYNLAQDTLGSLERPPLIPGVPQEKNHILIRMLLGILAPVPIAAIVVAAGTQYAETHSCTMWEYLRQYALYLILGFGLGGLPSIVYAISFELICSKFAINKHILLFISISALLMAVCSIHLGFFSFPLVLFTGIMVGLLLWPFRNRKKHNMVVH